MINCGYLLAFIVVYRYFRAQFVKIKEILLFFSYRIINKKPNKTEVKTEESESEQNEGLEESEMGVKKLVTI